jgi:ribosomal protein L37AE/L43A
MLTFGRVGMPSKNQPKPFCPSCGCENIGSPDSEKVYTCPRCDLEFIYNSKRKEYESI